MITLRAEAAADRAAIFSVNSDAFPSDAEARLVDRLRESVSPFVSVVACVDGEIAGHVLFTPVVVRSETREPWRAFGLAPLAVTPTLQRSGIGGRLIRAGFDALRVILRGEGWRDIEPVVVVLGHPAYYPKFGFRPSASHGLHYSHPGHDAAFFVIELEPGALANRTGVVHFAPAFDAL